MNFRGSKLRGEFWRADSADVKVSGELSIGEFGDATLKVEGSVKASKIFDANSDNYTVHGTIHADYEYLITLLRCFAVKTTFRLGSAGSAFFATITCNGLVIGAQISGMLDERFFGAEFSPLGLSEWAALKGFHGRVRGVGNAVTIKQKNQSTKPIILSDKSSISFLTRYDGPIRFDGAKRLNLIEVDLIKIETSNSESIDKIFRRITIWQSFISVATRQSAHVGDISLLLSNDSKVLLVFPQSKSVHKEPSASQFLFSRKNISRRLPQYVRRWYDNFQNIEPVIALYVGVGYQPNLYISLQFLSYAQALETFHRRTRKGEFQTHAQFKKKILGRLTSAVPSKLKAEYRERILAGMTHLNEWSLLNRLYELYDRDADVISKMFPDRDKDMRLIRDVRNYLTHYEGKKAKMSSYLVSREFVLLTFKLKLFIEICLLRSLRMQTRRIQNQVMQLSEFRWLKSESHQMK